MLLPLTLACPGLGGLGIQNLVISDVLRNLQRELESKGELDHALSTDQTEGMRNM